MRVSWAGLGGQDVAGVLARHALADPEKMDYNEFIVAYGAPPPPRKKWTRRVPHPAYGAAQPRPR